MGSDFSLRLSFHELPLSGIRVALGRDGTLEAGEPNGFAATAVTDSSGTARFSGIPAGKYTTTEKDGLLFPDDEIEVHAGTGPGEEILMKWPLGSLPVRTLRGKLITQAGESDMEHPLQSATVELLDLRSSRVLETLATIADGSYDFSTVQPGLYVLRIAPPDRGKRKRPNSRELAIELDPAARESTIPELKVEQSECSGVQILRRVAMHRWESPYSLE